MRIFLNYNFSANHNYRPRRLQNAFTQGIGLHPNAIVHFDGLISAVSFFNHLLDWLQNEIQQLDKALLILV